MKALHKITFLLTVIGGLNWGLIGLFDLNIIAILLGGFTGFVQITYLLVGASTVYIVATHIKECTMCSK